MHSSCVKRIATLFRLRPPSEENKPLASSTFVDNGSIVQDPKMTVYSGSKDSEAYEQSTDNGIMPSTGDSEEKPKMSPWRKFCFLFSFNGYIAYFVVLLWAVPCRHPLCVPPQSDWEMNISALLTTNMEATKHAGLPYSIIFGYSDENGAHLASLAIVDGTWMWNQSTSHTFRHVFCEFDVALEFNKSPGCIVTAENYIGVIDAATGNAVWQQNISISEDEIIHRVCLTKGPRNALYALGVSDAYLFVVDAKNGKKLPPLALPCSWTVGIELVGPWKLQKENHWLLVCEYGDKIEIWTFEEKKLLNPPKKVSQKGLRDDIKFNQLFSQDSSIGTIGLAGGVARSLDSLAVSWADIVVLVKAPASLHHFEKSWQRRFNGPLGDSLPVTSVISGHFTDPKKNEIAVTVQEGSNTTIHILDSTGVIVSSTHLGKGNVKSMDTIPGRKLETDTIVIESVRLKHRVEDSSQTHPSEQTTRSYFTMRYDGREIHYQNLISAQVYTSTLSQFSEGVADLVTASKGADDYTTIRRFMISTPSQSISCHSAHTRNISTMLLLD